MTTIHRIALITGGSRGLGRSMALQLARRGSDILLTYHSKEAEAAEVVRQVEALGRRAVALRFDAADSRGFEAFAARVKDALAAHWQRDRFDHLVNNAGVGVHANFADTTEAQFDLLV